MPKFQGGLKEIVKAVQLMDLSERKRLIADIAKNDPTMADAIKKSLNSLEDLIDVTPKMLVSFLSNISIEDLGLALKLHSPELQENLMGRMSSRNAQEIKDIIDGSKVRKSIVLDAQHRVMTIFRQMVDRGELIFSKDEKLV